ncbi:hypothetical protein TH61_04390 [Rufibacter sp. DG15C]|uniref:hypothetical protein n=1 Tax=Rufibacter sp. DG15C TaxID=1379909 RepID=UPI00078E3185|nr:hypothetical protein [Rufibacter sp. DG15C]AMM50568.1 hypothetical protein TH61_04390 [Rufibacter sp. DG15C]
MQDLTFPLEFTYKAPALSNQITVKDAHGQIVFFVKQVHSDVFSESSLLSIDPFLDEALVYKDASEKEILYSIRARSSKEFYAAFMFTDHNNLLFGHIGRVHWDYLLRAHYDVLDQYIRPVFTIKEAEFMVKVTGHHLRQDSFYKSFNGLFLQPKLLRHQSKR